MRWQRAPHTFEMDGRAPVRCVGGRWRRVEAGGRASRKGGVHGSSSNNIPFLFSYPEPKGGVCRVRTVQTQMLGMQEAGRVAGVAGLWAQALLEMHR